MKDKFDANIRRKFYIEFITRKEIYMLKFVNGSQIIFLSSANKTIRSKRSELIGFYCSNCKCVHEDYPIKDVQFIGESYQICKESYEKILEPYTIKKGE